MVMVEQGMPSRARVVFSVAGVPTDASGVGVTLTDAAGTSVPVVGAIGHPATGTYEALFDGRPAPTWINAAWTATVGGAAANVTNRIEVTGRLLFTTDELRQVRVMDTLAFTDTTDFPAERLAEVRDEVTESFEAICGQSFVPRYAEETIDGDGSWRLKLRHRPVIELRSLRSDGVAATSLTSWTVRPTGYLIASQSYRRAGRFYRGVGNYFVAYVHGRAEVPAEIHSAALARATMLLLPVQGGGSAASSWTTPDGTTYTYDPAGRRVGDGNTQHFGVPKLDSILNRNAYQMSGAPLVA